MKEIDEDKVQPHLKLAEGQRRHWLENLWQFLYDPITKVLSTLIGHGITQAGQFKRTGLSQPLDDFNKVTLFS